MNKKSRLLAGIICGLIICGLITRNGDFLRLALPFLVYLLTGVIQAPTEIALKVTRHLDRPSVTAGEAIEIRVVVENQGKPLVNLWLEDTQPPGLTILDEQPSQRLALSAGETVEMSYTCSAQRGVYTWQTLSVCACDPLGLFELRRAIPAQGELLVRPTPLQIRPTNLQSRATLHTAGSIAARLAGTGTDFWGIRAYRSGDSFRQINWQKAARHPQNFFTTEYEREEIADFGLILDARKRTADETVEAGLFENAVSAAASLGNNFLRNGNRVSLLVFGKSILTAFPGYGKPQHNRLLWNLARAKLGGNLALTNIEQFPTSLFPARSLLLVFSQFDPRDLAAYARLRGNGYAVILISPDPIDFAARMMVPRTDTNLLAARAARVERVLQLKHLLKLGIKVINWQVNQPLEPLVQETARRMLHRKKIGAW